MKNRLKSLTALLAVLLLSPALLFAELKMPDLNAASIEAAMSMVEGTAKSLGITVEG